MGLRSSLWIQFKPHQIAAGAAYLAAKSMNMDLTSSQHVWQEFQTPSSILKVYWTVCFSVLLRIFKCNIVRFGNTTYLHISVAFIQMLKALILVATFLMAVVCGTDKLRCDVFLNMLLVSVGVVVPSYGEIHFNVIGTAYQVTVIGRTGAVTIRVAGVLKDWILIALSTVIFPESIITGLNNTGYAIAVNGALLEDNMKDEYRMTQWHLSFIGTLASVKVFEDEDKVEEEEEKVEEPALVVMGDQAEIHKALMDYSQPKINDIQSSIIRPAISANTFEIKSSTIQMIHNSVQFGGSPTKDPNMHIRDFIKICDT
ncbi:hypothetical protein AgCh_027642 [Apium graveolens]